MHMSNELPLTIIRWKCACMHFARRPLSHGAAVLKLAHETLWAKMMMTSVAWAHARLKPPVALAQQQQAAVRW